MGPMSNAADHSGPNSRPGPVLPTPGDSESLLEDALRQQRAAWLGGCRMPAADWLCQFPSLAANPDQAAELIYHEFALRRELGESPDWQDYLRQFPECAVALQMLSQADALLEQAIQAPEPAPFQVEIDDYELLEEVGRGGMGVVYKARQKSLDRIVALKMIRLGEDPGEAERKRFHGEARAVARLHHPNIVQIYEVGEAGGRLFLTLEFIEGKSLGSRLNGTPWPARQAAALVETLAEAMQYAHDKQIIHRDLKPANVLISDLRLPNVELPGQSASLDFLDRKTAIKIADFGLAKRLDGTVHSNTEAVLGTPSYMAPEQAQAKQVIDVRTDVYGLGAVLYELLTGRPPFRADSALQTLRQVVEADPVRPQQLNPSVPRDLETVCLKCLAKEPSRRYASAEALADDLRRFAHGQPVLARPVGVLEHGWRWCRRNPALAGLTALLALALSGGLSVIVYQWYQTDAARREAIANAAQARQVLSELIQASPFAPQQEHYPEPPPIEPLLKAAEHCREFLQNNPEDTMLRIALTKVYGTLGARYGQLGQPAKQAAVLERALELWDSQLQPVRTHPDYHYWLATTRFWWGNLAFDRQQIAEGYRWFLFSDEVWEELTEAQPDNRDVLDTAALCRHELKRIAGLSAFAELCRPSLEALKTQLEQRLQESPGGLNRILRKRLALACLALGNARSQTDSPEAARACWQEAADLYAALEANGQASATAEEALRLALAGDAYSRLAGAHPSDAYYGQAVAKFERAGQELTLLRRRGPDHDWLRDAVRRVYCSLARCHTQAGRRDRAERIYQDRLRPLIDELEARRTEPQHVLSDELAMCQLVDGLAEAGLSVAALTMARRAAELTNDYVAFPLHYPELDFRMAIHAWDLSRGLRSLGDPAAALRQAEHARKLWADYWQARPDGYTGGVQLAQAWVEVGKSQQALGRHDEAWKAFRQAVSVQRRVLHRSPDVQYHRIYLDRCYDLLLDCGIRRSDWSGAAAALREREELWPGDSGKLRKAARDYASLAAGMTRTTKALTPDVESLYRRLLAESERCSRAATPAGK
jgi:serine/threonine protein kinase